MENAIELEGLGKILANRHTSPIVLDMFKTIGEVVFSALNGVGTQCGRVSCGGRGCSRQDRFGNVIHVLVSPS